MKKMIIALIMTMTIGTVSANAYNSFLDGKYVNISAIEFRTDAGVIDTLPTSGEVIVSAKVKKAEFADSNQTVTLIVALYKGDKLDRVEQESIALNNNYTTPIQKSVDVTGITSIRAFVCSNLDDAVPFSSKAVFAADDALIRGIKIGGEELDGFSHDKYTYDITLSAAYLSFPEITPVLSDSGTRCEIETQGNFPLSANQRAKAVIKLGNNSEKTYTINFTQAQPEITNYSAEGKFGGAAESRPDNVVTLVNDLRNPTYIVEPTEKVKLSTNAADGSDMTEGYGHKNLTNGVEFFNERIYLMEFLPEELKKATMIRTTYDFHGATDRKIFFDINRSATVYVAQKDTAEQLISDGFTLADGMKISWLSYMNETSTAGRVYMYNIYKKHYDVMPGEVLSVEIPHGAINAFVVFDESDFVKNATLRGTRASYNGQIINLPLVEVKDVEYLDWKNPNYQEGLDKYLYAAKFKSDKLNESFGFSTDFPEELIGSVGIAAPSNLRNYNRDVNIEDFISFDITESADVYVAYEAEYADMPWLESLGYTDVSEEIEPITYVDSASENVETSKMYKKSYDVLPGETVKVNIGGFPSKDSEAPLMIFVKKQK